MQLALLSCWAPVKSLAVSCVLADANYTRPPPDLIAGEAKYEVEQILDACRRGRGCKLQYYIKWKGFPMSDSTWEPPEHLNNAQDLITDFYRLHPMAEGAPKEI